MKNSELKEKCRTGQLPKNKTCGECHYFKQEEEICSHNQKHYWSKAEFEACTGFEPKVITNGDKIRQKARGKMSVDWLHIICGNCGHDATDGNFTWRHRPKEDYGNGEFNSADVLISCKNCGTLHSLGKYMQEESEGER